MSGSTTFMKPSTHRSSSRVVPFAVALGVASSSMVACGVLIGVTDPELRTTSDAGSLRDAEAGSLPTDAASVGGTCDAADLSSDPENCGACDNSCDGKSCDSGICDGDKTSGLLGDVREIVVGGSFLYVVQTDGIYRTDKTTTTVGKKISDLRGAKLSVDADSAKLYAVGATSDTATKVGISCNLPCDGSGWTTLPGIEADATSIVPAGAGTALIVGSGRIWILGSGGDPLFSKIKVNEGDEKGSRVRKTSGLNQFVWTVSGDPNVYAIERPAANYIYKKYYCASCSDLGFDALVMWSGAAWTFGVVDNGNVSFGSAVDADKPAPQLQIDSTVYESGEARSLALLNSSNVYARTPNAILKCPLPLFGGKGTCTSLTTSVAGQEVTAIASEGATFYYASVAKAGTDQATARITQAAAR